MPYGNAVAISKEEKYNAQAHTSVEKTICLLCVRYYAKLATSARLTKESYINESLTEKQANTDHIVPKAA